MAKITICLIVLSTVLACHNTQNDILYYTTAYDLIERVNENEDLSTVFKNHVIQISGEVIFRQQAKDNMPLKNKSDVYFGERDSNNHFIDNKLVICFFDFLITDHVKIGDNIVVQGCFKKIDKDGTIIFEKCKIVKPLM
jgi:hypothetical protein